MGGIAHEGCGPFRLVDICQLLEHDLDFLAIGRALSDETEAFGGFHLGRRSIFEQMRHIGVRELADLGGWNPGIELARYLGKSMS